MTRVVIRRVQVLVPGRLAQRDVAAERGGGNLDPTFGGGLARKGARVHLHGARMNEKRMMTRMISFAFLMIEFSAPDDESRVPHNLGYSSDVSGVSPLHRDGESFA